jgi:hypothetical protein
MKRPAVGLIVLAAMLAAPYAVNAAGSSRAVAPPSGRVLGRSYSEWMVASWQWVLAHGHSYVGTNARGVSCLAKGQRGSVWFLQDEYEGDAPVVVNCEVPGGRYLFLEGPTFECSTVEAPPFQATRRGLVGCARKFALGGARVSLDGRPLTPSVYPVATPAFPFLMPAVANVLKVPGQTHGYAAVQGDAVMLRPLRAGIHTIVQVERFSNGTAVETTWKLKVR